MTDRRRWPVAAALVAGILALGACAATEPRAAPFDASSLDRFRGADGLLHDHDATGLDGRPLAEGSLEEGLWTTAAALRLLQTEGIEPRLDRTTAATVDATADTVVSIGGDPTALLGVARICALTARDSRPCAAAASEARELLTTPDAVSLDDAQPVALIETASDLGMTRGTPGTALHRALTDDAAGDCVRSAVIRHHVPIDRPVEPRVVPDPRALTDVVLAALERGDIDAALCSSGLAAATPGATPVRDEDWLRTPFADAVDAGFDRLSDGWYRARASGLGAVEVTRMLSQVSFDLSVELNSVELNR